MYPMKNSHSARKVVLGLSGGVDSTAAALLLMDKGYEVVGVYVDVLGEYAAPREIADQLGIQLICADASKEFEETVI
jgi:tRNA-specific 2-thiouridylase